MVWASLNYIYKSTDQAPLLHSEQKEWVEKWASQDLEDLYRELSEREYRDLAQAQTSQDRRSMLQKINSSFHRAFNLIHCEIRIDEGQHQVHSKQIEGYLTGSSHFRTHWHQAYIQNRSNWWRGRQVRTQEIYISCYQWWMIEVWG